MASYPKSGNTWLRSLLTAYLFPDEEFSLNAMIGEQDPFDRQLLDDHAGISSADYAPEELIYYQAQLHLEMGRANENRRFIKTHSAYIRSADGVALFPDQASAGAIIVVRNPIDIVPSFAHHQNSDLDWAIDEMENLDAGLNKWPTRSSMMLPQTMSDWSANVRSWLDQTAIPTHVLRYEDMHRDPEGSLAAVLRFCAIDVEADKVAKAVDRCRIDRLREDEKSGGFNERPSARRTFFRSGKTGDGARAMSDKQKLRILETHRSTMEALGYSADLDDYILKQEEGK
ncbi:sulfotransferase domain-containing protein [Pontixanthobacter aquaemixtae]|uniref:sulfotransferase domain-containing protein n=1 Tax=Pontixanthobacter aquaemixtae TaxID=1958940 RepID=UPI0022A73B8A|nr:sulfotransferase domain-containing protein [Pontixanthobacter aquaemixtae]